MSEIDPREFGKLEAQVASLQAEVSAMRDDIKALLEMANKSKAGCLWEWLLPVLLAVSFLLLQPS